MLVYLNINKDNGINSILKKLFSHMKHSHVILPQTLLNTITEKETKAQMWAYPEESSRDYVTQLSV